MAKLPQFQNSNRDFQLMQSSWSSVLNPFLTNPLTNGNFLTSVNLLTGQNVINHKLARMPQGWFITDQNAAANIYRSAVFTTKTLTLNSSASVEVNLYVF